jgi:hypothetical protein
MARMASPQMRARRAAARTIRRTASPTPGTDLRPAQRSSAGGAPVAE